MARRSGARRFTLTELLMLNTLKPDMLKRYKDLARLLWKHARGEWFEHAELQQLFQLSEREHDDQDDEADKAGEADERAGGDAPATAQEEKAGELADDLEALGPTYVKLGQMLASRADLLPPPYLEGLKRLQDHIEPFPYEEAKRIFEQEIGVDPGQAFAAFDSEPMAAASLGQVHRATTRSGESVVVKIQRPNIRQQIALDLEAIHHVAEMLDSHSDAARNYQVLNIVEQFESVLIDELDYTKEADHLRVLAENLKTFDRIVVPKPIDRYTSSRVLTMTYIDAKRIEDLTEDDLTGDEGIELAEHLLHAYLKQILLDGFFHADPHAGNVLVTPDKKIALLDLGMVGRFSPTTRERLLNLLLAVSEGRSEDVATLSMKLGEGTDEFDPHELRRQVDSVVVMTQAGAVEKLQIGHIVMSVCRAAAKAHLRIPPRVSLLGKTMVHLDEVGQALAPRFDPNASVRRHASEMVQKRMWQSLHPSELMHQMMEIKDFVQRMPDRVGRILDALADNDLKLHIDAVDEDRLIRGLKNIANRVTVGLVIAAMIIGAAMLMHIETSFTLFGYPGLAILLFISAIAIGGVLIFRVMWSDRDS